MTLEQDLASIAAQCEQLISAHEYDPDTDACARCEQSWACPVRLGAEELLDGLQRLPLLDPALYRAGIIEREEHRMSTPDIEGWRKSSFSDNSGGNCVEVKSTGGAFAVRDTKFADSPILVFSATEWLAFTQGVRAGEFDE
jgi:hypothetical protein